MNAPHLLSRVLAACATLTIVPLTAAPENPEVIARYEQMLLQSPRTGTAFDRVCEAYAGAGGLDALDTHWAEKAKADDGAVYLILQGLLAQRQGRTKAAARLLDEAVKRMPDRVEAWIASAAAEADAGRGSEAVARYEKALSLGLTGEERLEAFRRMVQLQQRLLKSGDAVKTLQRMAAEYPDDPFVMSEVGDALVEVGRTAEARGIFEKLRDKPGADAFQRLQAMLKLASLEEQAKGRDAAIAIYEQVLADSAETSWIHRETRQRIEDSFRNQDDLPGLVAYYQKRLKAEPRDVESVYRLAQALAALARNDESAAQWQRAIEMAPERREFLQEYAAQMVASGKPQGAVELLRKLVRDDPDNADHDEALGEALWKVAEISGRAEDRKAAVEAWTAIAPPDSTDLPRITRVAQIFASHDLKNEALPFFERALKIQPDAFDLREAWAGILAKLGRKKDADAVLAAAVDGNLRTPENYLSLAGAYRRLERTDDARAVVAAGLAIDPKNFDLLVLKTRLLSESEEWSAVADMHAALMAAAPGPQYVDNLERQYIEALESADKLKTRQTEMLSEFEGGQLADEANMRLLARMLLRANDGPNARKVLDVATKSFPKSVEIARLESDFEDRFGTLEAQRAALRRLVELDAGGRAQWLSDIAHSYEDEGKWDDALKAAEERIQLSPASPDGYLFYAEICFSAGRADAGILKLQEALRLSNDPVGARVRLARAYADMGNGTMAIRTQEEAFNQETDAAKKLQMIGPLADYYMQDGRIDELIDRLKTRQRAEEGTHYSAYLGEIYMQMQNYSAAREEMARALAIRPRDAALLQQLLRLAGLENNTDEQLKYSRTLAEVDPSLDHRLDLIDALAQAGENDEAASLVRQLGPEWLKQDASDEILQLLGNRALRGAVMDTLREQLKQKNADWRISLSLASVLISMNNLEEADKLLERVLAMNDSEFQFPPQQPPPANSPGGYSMLRANFPPALQRLALAEQQASRTVETLRNIIQMQRRGGMGGYYSRFSGRSAYAPGGLALQSTPQGVRDSALVMRAYIAVSLGREKEFLAEWQKAAAARGLSPEDRITELASIQALPELRAVAQELAKKPDATVPELEMALFVLQRFDRDEDGSQQNKAIQDRIVAIIIRLLETNAVDADWFDMNALQILSAAGRKKEAGELLDRMIAGVDKADAAQALATMMACLNLNRVDDAQRIYSTLMIRVSASPGSRGLYDEAMYAGIRLASLMMQSKERRQQGLEMLAAILRETYGASRSSGAGTMGLRMGGSSGRFGGMSPYMLATQNLDQVVPLPTKRFDFRSREQLQRFWQQLKSMEAIDEFQAVLKKQAEVLHDDERIYPQLASIYFQWWDGKKAEAVEATRQLAKENPDEDLSAFLASMLTMLKDYKGAGEVLAGAAPQSRDEAVRNVMLGISIATRAKDAGKAKALTVEFEKLWPQSEERSAVSSMLRALDLDDEAQRVQNGGTASTRGNSGEPPLVKRLSELRDKESRSREGTPAPGAEKSEDYRARAISIARGVLLSGTPSSIVEQRNSLRQISMSTLQNYSALEALINETAGALAKQPDSLKLNALMAELTRYNSSGRSLPYFKKLVELQPQNTRLQANVASMLQSNNQADEAVKIYRKLMDDDFSAFILQGSGDVFGAYQEAKRLSELADLFEKKLRAEGPTFAEQSASIAGSYGSRFADAEDYDAAARMYRLAMDLGNRDSSTEQAYLQVLLKQNKRDEAGKMLGDILFPEPQPPRLLLASLFPSRLETPWDSWNSGPDNRPRNSGALMLEMVGPKGIEALRQRAADYRKRLPDNRTARLADLYVRIRLRDAAVLDDVRSFTKDESTDSMMSQALAGELADWIEARPLALEVAISARDAMLRDNNLPPEEYIQIASPLIDMAIECEKPQIARKELKTVLAKFKQGGANTANRIGVDTLLRITESALDIGLASEALDLLLGLEKDDASEDYIKRRIAQVEPEYQLAAGKIIAPQAFVWQVSADGGKSAEEVTLAWRLGAARPVVQSSRWPNLVTSMRDISALNGKYDLDLIVEIPPNITQRVATISAAKFTGRWTGKLPDGAQTVMGVLRARGSSTSYSGLPFQIGIGKNFLRNPDLSLSTDGQAAEGWTGQLGIKRLDHGGPDNQAPAIDVAAAGRTVKIFGERIPIDRDREYMQMAWYASLNSNSSCNVGVIILDENKKQIDSESCSYASDRPGWRLATQYISTHDNTRSGFRSVSKKAKWMQPYIECSYPTRISGMWLGEVPPVTVQEEDD